MVKTMVAKAAAPIRTLPYRAGAADHRRRMAAGLGTVVAAVAAATIATVWAMQQAGYVPCELCLAERNPYYVGVPLALLAGGAAWAGRPVLARTGFGLLALIFIAGAGLAAYHAGVEGKLWAGPTGCSGPMSTPTSASDFLAALKSVKVVRCDAPALVVFGLSLAAWNVPLSLLLAIASGYAGWVTPRAPAV